MHERSTKEIRHTRTQCLDPFGWPGLIFWVTVGRSHKTGPSASDNLELQLHVVQPHQQDYGTIPN